MSTTRTRTTTARGLGWRHQQNRQRLIARHTDGTPCWWCDLPMHGDNANHLNWDTRALAADHTQPRAIGGQHADRLLHGTCNSQRQAGQHDHNRPALTGIHPQHWTPNGQPAIVATGLAMDW